MERTQQICSRLYQLTHIPITLVSGECAIICSWPNTAYQVIGGDILEIVLSDFRFQHRDETHPLISYFEPGFFLGVCQLRKDLFALIGMVSPIPHSRQEILKLCVPVIPPANLQKFCDLLLQMPLFSLDQVRDFICLLVELTQKKVITHETILFNDIFMMEKSRDNQLAEAIFTHREDAEFHVPIDFETALCSAVENGRKSDLMRILFTPTQGRIGRMSSNALRQEKYHVICLATLISRAAIRGGLQEEIAFSMSDSFCQSADQMTDVVQLQRLCFSMMTEFCDRVHDARERLGRSAIILKCLDYISIHLHEPITLDILSAHCGLCSRSLSIRFRDEVGMGIPEYIHREKVQEAKYLLLHTQYTLSEIACYLNYPSQSYFTQIFRKHCGATPQQYRERKSV